MSIMQIQDQPHIGVLGADPAAITQFLRRVQALGGEHAVLLPLSPAAVPDCEPYLCGASTQPPLPQVRACADMVTDTVENDGIAHALRRLKLIE